MWEISDIDGGNKRSVTLAQYLAEVKEMGELAALRHQMSAALHRKDVAAYHRLGAEHRRVLHAACPAVKAAWEGCKAQS